MKSPKGRMNKPCSIKSRVLFFIQLRVERVMYLSKHFNYKKSPASKLGKNRRKSKTNQSTGDYNKLGNNIYNYTKLFTQSPVFFHCLGDFSSCLFVDFQPPMRFRHFHSCHFAMMMSKKVAYPRLPLFSHTHFSS